MAPLPPSPRDPTAVLASRVLALAIDVGLILVVLLLVFWRSHLPDYVHVRPAGSATSTCDLINRTGRFRGVPHDRVDAIALRDGTTRFLAPGTTCIPVGRTVYVLTDHQLTALRTMVWQVALAVAVANLLVLQGIVGASVGKLLVGLRVIAADARRAEPTRILVRTALLPIDAFPLGAIGLIAVLTTRGHRRVGDLAAGTFVVHRSSLRDDDADQSAMAAAGDQATPTPTEPGADPLGAPATGAPDPDAGPPPAPTPPGASTGPAATADAPPIAIEAGTLVAPEPDDEADEPTGPPPAAEGEPVPVYDPVREVYVRYDPDARAWYRWDDARRAWVRRDP